MLRAKGLSATAVVRHAVRNALPQILAVMGLQFGYLVGGSILVETVFTWPGTGFLLSKAILTRDIPLLQGTILVLSLSFVATNSGRRSAADRGRSAHQARLRRRMTDFTVNAERLALAEPSAPAKSRGYLATVFDGCATTT